MEVWEILAIVFGTMALLILLYLLWKHVLSFWAVDYALFYPSQLTPTPVSFWITKPWLPEEKIPVLFIPSPQKSSPYLIVYSHGNNENLSTARAKCTFLAESTGMNVLVWDYSGYGRNPYHAYERSTEGMIESLRTIIRAMQDKFALDHIYLMGYSLGTGVSTAVAKQSSDEKTPPAGLILISAYTSIRDIIADMISPLLSRFFPDKLETITWIRDVQCPILIIHGTEDSLIQIQHARNLHDASEKHSQLVELPRQTHGINWRDELFISSVTHFLNP